MGAQEVEIFTANEVAAQAIPLAHIQSDRQDRRGRGLYGRAGLDGQLVVGLRHIEMMHRIAERIGIGKHLGIGIER